MYTDDWSKIYDESWKIRGEFPQELISEPFKENILNPERLKNYFPDFYELIKEVVE